MFDVIVADARAPRDGRFIEKIGTYNPNSNPATINIDAEKAFTWMMNGAQPTETVKAMLSYKGVLFRKHLQIGVNKGALTQEQADAKLQEWKDSKEAKIAGKVEDLSQKRVADEKSRREAETKVKEARAEAIRKRQEEAAALLNPPAEEAETPTDETEAPAEGETSESTDSDAPKTEENA